MTALVSGYEKQVWFAGGPSSRWVARLFVVSEDGTDVELVRRGGWCALTERGLHRMLDREIRRDELLRRRLHDPPQIEFVSSATADAG